METSYSNKPYVFVPFTDSVAHCNAPYHRDILGANTYMGKLEITIECMTPLHFGSGQLEFDEPDETFAHSLLRENGKIALPGSSFKGMLRSVFEAISPSCVLNAPKALPGKVGEARQSCGAYTNSGACCPACSVFGRLSYKGKLIITSFRTDYEPSLIAIPQLENPFKTYPNYGTHKPRAGNERLYYGEFNDVHGLDVAKMSKSDFFDKKDSQANSGRNFYGRKFYKHSDQWETISKSSGKDSYECLPVGATLAGGIAYQGLAKDELGALLFALGLGWGQPIYHKVGYAKPAFFGSVKLTVKPHGNGFDRYRSETVVPRGADETLATPKIGMVTSEAEAEALAVQYYDKHKKSIESAVVALKEAWSCIGNSVWPVQDGKYGY
jgi:hypothetical protein